MKSQRIQALSITKVSDTKASFVKYTSCWVLPRRRFSVTIHNDMVQVTRKDEREANENIIRRFNRKVLQSGVLAEAKASMRFSKPLSKTERRQKAIIRKERKAIKTANARMGIR